MIGEDTSNHIVNLVWIWDFKTSSMTRVAAVPMGSETTSPYWYKIGNWYYMTLVAQHPYGAGTLATSRVEYDTHLAKSVATGRIPCRSTCETCACCCTALCVSTSRFGVRLTGGGACNLQQARLHGSAMLAPSRCPRTTPHHRLSLLASAPLQRRPSSPLARCLRLWPSRPCKHG